MIDKFKDEVDRMYEIKDKIFEIELKIRKESSNKDALLLLIDEKRSLLDDFDNLNLVLYEYLIEKAKEENVKKLVFVGRDENEITMSLEE